MKSRILIIEDNYCKFFAAKQVLESQLKMKVDVADAGSTRELVIKAAAFNPDLIMYRPAGGVAELLAKMKKRRTNRRNSEIVLILAEGLDDTVGRQVADVVDRGVKTSGDFATAA
jgi:hypothetical protein